jgi:DNA-binding MarR family transcriptional regulator
MHSSQRAVPSIPGVRASRGSGRGEPVDYVDAMIDNWRGLNGADAAAVAIIERVVRIGRAFEKEAEMLCSDYGISLWAFAVLLTLRLAGAPYQLTPTELYRAGMVSSGGMAKRLKQLEAEGYIDRAPAEDDGRSVYVRLTRKGRRVVDQVAPEYVALQREAVADLTRTERRSTAQLLRAMLVGFEEAGA